LVLLAVETGIPISEWTDADEIYTAIEILKEKSLGE
jgi:hypothetical protein